MQASLYIMQAAKLETHHAKVRIYYACRPTADPVGGRDRSALLLTNIERQMNEDERWLFDVQGYLRIRRCLDPALLESLNDSLAHSPHVREAAALGSDGAPIQQPRLNKEGVARRVDIGGMLGWERPWSDPFRELMDYEPVAARLDEILGRGHRLDHSPVCITMEKGMAGAALHGGGADRASLINSSFFHAGEFYTGMVVVVFFLAPEGPGDGGLGIVRGSHKANLPMQNDHSPRQRLVVLC